jgi:hypothetical protein
MLRNSNSREISREFFLVLVKTLEFCPFFAILCQEQGMSRDFAGNLQFSTQLNQNRRDTKKTRISRR